MVSLFARIEQIANILEGAHLIRPQLDWNRWLPPKLRDGHGIGQSQLYVIYAYPIQAPPSLKVDWCAAFVEACKDKTPTGAGIGLIGLSYGISLIAIVTVLLSRRRENTWSRYTSDGRS
jgi:hypothetical protein